MPELSWASPGFVPPLPPIGAGPYLAEARRRLERLTSGGLTLTFNPPAALRPERWAEAQRWRLAEAWRRTQAGMHQLERRLGGLTAAPGALDHLRSELLAHYCANILRYQAAAGCRPGAPRQIVPAEWMRRAAASAMLSVIQAALMLWVLQRPAAGRRTPARRRPTPAWASAPVRPAGALIRLPIPLRL